MKYLILFLFSINITQAAEVKVEPVYGFERVFRATPAPAKFRTVVFTGVRGTYGVEHIAAEFELNQSISDTSTPGTKMTYTVQKLLVGARLIPGKTDFLNVYFRLGMRAMREQRETTVSGITKKVTDDPKWDPYAGTGLTLNFNSVFALNTSATLVFNKDEEGNDRFENRYTFGASFKFGNK
jgi:hypothetical protein